MRPELKFLALMQNAMRGWNLTLHITHNSHWYMTMTMWTLSWSVDEKMDGAKYRATLTLKESLKIGVQMNSILSDWAWVILQRMGKNVSL